MEYKVKRYKTQYKRDKEYSKYYKKTRGKVWKVGSKGIRISRYRK